MVKGRGHGQMRGLSGCYASLFMMTFIDTYKIQMYFILAEWWAEEDRVGLSI